ncbi:MAG: TonB-dependent receptor [Gammaproteobacteria bacterium]|nr:TonB-dependent receptor [Gammaproteobacteria bacterium]
MDALLGAYYLDATAFNEFDVLLGLTGDLIGLPGLNAYTLGEVDTQSWAVFGDVTLDLGRFGGDAFEDFELSLGGRYTSDEREARILRQTMLGKSASFGGPNTVIATTSDFEGAETFTEFTPRVSLAWQPTPEQNLYLSWSEGFKGGGFDPRGATTAAPDLDNDGTVSDGEVQNFMQFEPETISTWEIGAKSDWLDGRVTTRLALFTSEYTDVQIPGSIGVDSDNDGVADSFAGVTTNAGEASFDGIEFEGSALVQQAGRYRRRRAVGVLEPRLHRCRVRGIRLRRHRSGHRADLAGGRVRRAQHPEHPGMDRQPDAGLRLPAGPARAGTASCRS